MQLSVIVLTYNEEVNLAPCLESVTGVASEIVVVDSGSTDATVEIARQHGARVVEHPFETQAKQLNWALDNVAMEGEWVLRLDADERLTPELGAELAEKLPGLGEDVTGLYFKRRVYFLGRWIRHGGYYPTWLLRVWRRGAARSEDREMDEHMVLLRGDSERLDHDIIEENMKGLFDWTDRQNRYSTREVRAALSARSGEIEASFWGPQEARKRWLKYRVYMAAPPFLRAAAYFLWRYVVRLGFLDGRQGLVFHALQGGWYRFLVDAKLLEHRQVEERDRSHVPAVQPKSKRRGE